MNLTKLQRADENYFESFRLLVEHMKKGQAFLRPELKYTDSGLAASFFNNVFLCPPYADAASQLQVAHDYFKSAQRPYRLVVREEYREVAHDAAQHLALNVAEKVPLMTHEDIAQLKAPEDFQYKQVTNEADLNDFRQVMLSAFEFPPWLIERVLTSGLLNEPQLVMLVGYEEGVACTGAMLIQQGDLAGIYWVGTKKGYERKGLAAKATTQAIIIGRELGCEWAVLQASDKGQAVYQRMGFETQAYYHYQVYEPQLTSA